MTISGLVITYNEENNIEKCLEAMFRVCSEVIVVDSFSTDKTVELATIKGAKVYSQKFLGDGPQRAFGVPYCKNDWILNLDADEFLDADAEEFILSETFLKHNSDAFYFRFKNFLGEKLINFSGWYPDNKIRFFNKLTAHPSADSVHQKIISKKPQKVNVHILHYGSNSFHQIIAKKNQYSDWHAQQLFDNGKRANSFKPILNGLVSFIRCYFFKKGILNGLDGLTFAIIQGFFSYIKYVKLIQLQVEAKQK
jgi:glycosyltransferase involved in cell wall biosynthesis